MSYRAAILIALLLGPFAVVHGQQYIISVDAPNNDPLVQPAILQQNQWLISIGVENYQSVGTAPGAVASAANFASTLQDQYFFSQERSLILNDGEATLEKVQAAFTSIEERALSTDSVVLYFSGRSKSGETQNYWYLHDSEDDDPRTLLSNREVLDFVKRLNDKGIWHVLIVVDGVFQVDGLTGNDFIYRNQYRTDIQDFGKYQDPKLRSRQVIASQMGMPSTRFSDALVGFLRGNTFPFFNHKQMAAQVGRTFGRQILLYIGKFKAGDTTYGERGGRLFFINRAGVDLGGEPPTAPPATATPVPPTQAPPTQPPAQPSPLPGQENPEPPSLAGFEIVDAPEPTPAPAQSAPGDVSLADFEIADIPEPTPTQTPQPTPAPAATATPTPTTVPTAPRATATPVRLSPTEEKEWQQHLTKVRALLLRAEQAEMSPVERSPVDDKRQAWLRVLREVWDKDNPLTTEDDFWKLRSAERVTHWTRAIRLKDVKVEAPQPQSINPVSEDSRFIARANGTVLDKQTGLEWASRDNGEDISYWNAERAARKSAHGGMNGWRLPTRQEAASLLSPGSKYKVMERNYDVHITDKIQLTSCCIWVGIWNGANNKAGYFDYQHGIFGWTEDDYKEYSRLLMVRGGAGGPGNAYTAQLGGSSVPAVMVSEADFDVDSAVERRIREYDPRRRRSATKEDLARAQKVVTEDYSPDLTAGRRLGNETVDTALSLEEQEEWTLWLEDRRMEFRQARLFDAKSNNVVEPPKKKAKWLKLLAELKRSDHPLTKEDDEMFTAAIERVSHWNRHMARKKAGPQVSMGANRAPVSEETTRYVSYANNTVLDKQTGLMWSAADNGSDIEFWDAQAAAENSTLGGFSDWRLPTPDEAKTLLDLKSPPQEIVERDYPVYVTPLIGLTRCCIWLDYWDSEDAGYFDFAYGEFSLTRPLRSDDSRMLLVRDAG